MHNSDFLEKLRELNAELAIINEDEESVEQIDDETVAELSQLVEEANELVNQAHEAHGANEDYSSQRDDVVDRIRQFETEHPRVTQFLSHHAPHGLGSQAS